MFIGILSLSILLALGAAGLMLVGIRLGRRVIHLNSIIGFPVLIMNSAMFVGAIACGIGAYHCFTKAFGG